MREKGGYVRGHVWDEDEKTKWKSKTVSLGISQSDRGVHKLFTVK